MNLEEIKQKECLFANVTFGEERSYTAPLYHLQDEVGEAIESGELSEFADCLLLLLDAYGKRFPNLHTDELLKACDAKIEINKKRKWTAAENGTFKHVPDESDKNGATGESQ